MATFHYLVRPSAVSRGQPARAGHLPAPKWHPGHQTASSSPQPDAHIHTYLGATSIRDTEQLSPLAGRLPR